MGFFSELDALLQDLEQQLTKLNRELLQPITLRPHYDYKLITKPIDVKTILLDTKKKGDNHESEF